jgi:intracellular sulfur oxidation DsrE/DsrF family protein
MKISFRIAALVGAIVVSLAAALAAADQLPIPGFPAAKDVPGARLLPDPAVEYKVVFDAAGAAENVDDVNPMLAGVARYVNTLAKYGVPAENRKIAVVLHQGATPAILKNAAFKARNDDHDNPNIALIRDLHAAGVKFHVCGQAVLGRDIDPDDILDEIELDLWALTTLIEFGRQGYVQIGG